jgi:hypothetical protein
MGASVGARVGIVNEFRRAHPRRTHVGDVFREPCTGVLREVTEVWGASEYIAMKVDGRFYRYRSDAGRNSLAAPVRAIRNEHSASNWRLS